MKHFRSARAVGARLVACIAISIVAALAGGCMLSSSSVGVRSMDGGPTGPKAVTFLNATPYMPDMIEALAEQGFSVKPMPSQQFVTQNEGSGKIGQYNEAATRYGITLVAAPTSLTCVLTSHAVYNFTLMVTDIRNDEIVLILKQEGSDGPCTTIKPVFPTLAAALASAWR